MDLFAFFNPRVLRAHGGAGYTFGAFAILVMKRSRVGHERDLDRGLELIDENEEGRWPWCA